MTTIDLFHAIIKRIAYIDGRLRHRHDYSSGRYG